MGEHLNEYLDKQLVGSVKPPADILAAARKSLDDKSFSDLMAETGGQPPTPDQLCKKVDEVRRTNPLISRR